MQGINNSEGANNEVITIRRIHAFGETLNKKQSSSIFSSFLQADKYDAEGGDYGDSKLIGDEINEFFTAIGTEMKEKFCSWFKRTVEAEEICNNIATFNSDGEYTHYDKKIMRKL